MDSGELIQHLREQRLITLSLADQVKEDRWREPVMPGGWTIHDLLAHLIAWDEWAVATFEISLLRELPQVLQGAPQDVNAFNARAAARMRGLTRDDVLSGLQSASGRVVFSATMAGGAEWQNREIPDLATKPADGQPAGRVPTVGGILRRLLSHEQAHGQEVSDTFGVSVDLDELRGKSADNA